VLAAVGSDVAMARSGAGQHRCGQASAVRLHVCPSGGTLIERSMEGPKGLAALRRDAVAACVPSVAVARPRRACGRLVMGTVRAKQQRRRPGSTAAGQKGSVRFNSGCAKARPKVQPLAGARGMLAWRGHGVPMAI